MNQILPGSDVALGAFAIVAMAATIGDARWRFASVGHTAYPIVDDGQVLGIVTRGDVLRDVSPDSNRLLDIAAQDVISVSDDGTAQAVPRIMVDEDVEHVPVVDEHGRLVGICTRTDLLKVRRRELEHKRASGIAGAPSGHPPIRTETSETRPQRTWQPKSLHRIGVNDYPFIPGLFRSGS